MRRWFAGMCVAVVCCVLVLAPSGLAREDSSNRGDRFVGQCHKMMIVKVIDGDTVYGYIDTSDPIIALRANLRLRDIQSPEKGRFAQCREEREKGREATRFLSEFLSPVIRRQSRSAARVCALTRGKYALRRIGRLEVRIDGQWVDVGRMMLRNGYAIPYFQREASAGKRRRYGRDTWCKCLRFGDCPRV